MSPAPPPPPIPTAFPPHPPPSPSPALPPPPSSPPPIPLPHPPPPLPHPSSPSTSPPSCHQQSNVPNSPTPSNPPLLPPSLTPYPHSRAHTPHPPTHPTPTRRFAYVYAPNKKAFLCDRPVKLRWLMRDPLSCCAAFVQCRLQFGRNLTSLVTSLFSHCRRTMRLMYLFFTVAMTIAVTSAAQLMYRPASFDPNERYGSFTKCSACHVG